MRPFVAPFTLLLGLVPMLLLWGGCKTKYVCPAYTSAFQLDMPTYKRSHMEDSLVATADTNLDADVIMVLAERIKKDPISRYEYDADSVPQFPSNPVAKTEVLLIRRISRKRKDKVMASVPMITIFPPKSDSAKGDEENLTPEERQAVPAGDTEQAPAEDQPQEKDAQDKKEGKKEEKDENPF